MSIYEMISKSRKNYCGDIVDLKEKYRLSEELASDGVATIYYNIFIHDKDIRVGSIDLRLKNDGDMYYFGNIGYSIMPKHQGHHYAYEACKTLFKVAKDEFNLENLIMTCSPDNIASRKTIEKLNCDYIETVDVPINHELYLKGERVKCIYKIVL